MRSALPAILFCAAAAAHAGPDPKAADEQAWKAVETCQFAIMATLHDPKSAEFPGISRSYRKLDKGVYTTQVQVRARNAMNALRLTTVECRIDAKSGKLLSIKQL